MLHLSIFRKFVEKIQVSLKYDNNGCFTWRPTYFFDHISMNSLRMRSVSDKICRENQNTYFMFNSFCWNIVPFMRKSVKNCRAQQAIAHVHWMLDTWGYKHTLRICNTYCFSCNKGLCDHTSMWRIRTLISFCLYTTKIIV